MTTLYLTHPSSLEHVMPPGHPECVDRLKAIEKALAGEKFQLLERGSAPRADLELLALAHPMEYVRAIKEAAPDKGFIYIDADTSMSPGTWSAALHGAGAAAHAVDQVMTGEVENAFCAMRPPGHHAEADRAMGFCLFDNAAIAALHARAAHGAERVAVIDFDVHHGNGTQDIFWSDKDMFYGSTHQMPLFPGTGAARETGVGNICNAPLSGNDDGIRFRAAMSEQIFPALEDFSPDLIVISAGFDAHRDDPLASINLVEEDFRWITMKLAEIAHKCADGRMVSVLEGGYNLQALADSVAVHVDALMQSGS